MTEDETVARDSVLLYMQNADLFKDQQSNLSVIPEKAMDPKVGSISPNDENDTLGAESTDRAKDAHTVEKKPADDSHDATQGLKARGEGRVNDVTKASPPIETEPPPRFECRTWC